VWLTRLSHTRLGAGRTSGGMSLSRTTVSQIATNATNRSAGPRTFPPVHGIRQGETARVTRWGGGPSSSLAFPVRLHRVFHLAAHGGKYRVKTLVGNPRPRQRNLEYLAYRPGPWAQEDHTVRQETASAMSWVTNRMVGLRALHTFKRSRCICSRVMASRAPKGSSIRRIPG